MILPKVILQAVSEPGLDLGWPVLFPAHNSFPLVGDTYSEKARRLYSWTTNMINLAILAAVICQASIMWLTVTQILVSNSPFYRLGNCSSAWWSPVAKVTEQWEEVNFPQNVCGLNGLLSSSGSQNTNPLYPPGHKTTRSSPLMGTAWQQIMHFHSLTAFFAASWQSPGAERPEGQSWGHTAKIHSQNQPHGIVCSVKAMGSPVLGVWGSLKDLDLEVGGEWGEGWSVFKLPGFRAIGKLPLWAWVAKEGWIIHGLQTRPIFNH